MLLWKELILPNIDIFEVGQHSTYSEPKEIYWNKLFQDFNFESKRERSLALSLSMLYFTTLICLNEITAPEELGSRILHFPASKTEKVPHASGIAPNFVKQESQNTGT